VTIQASSFKGLTDESQEQIYESCTEFDE